MSRAHCIIEIGTEELPPKSLAALQNAFMAGIVQQLESAQLDFSAIKPFATPRRLAIQISDLHTEQPDKKIERKGPSVNAPEKAISGFAESCGVTPDALSTVKTAKGEWYLYQGVQAGKKTEQLLPDMIQKSLEQLPITKRMRWGDRKDEFVRPVKWLVIMLDDQLVPASLFGIESNRLTYGHRVHCHQALELTHALNYEECLLTGYVVADFEQRKQRIRSQIHAVAEEKGLNPIINEALLDEVTAINEWPVALLGQFDQAFLSVPAEALISSMEEHQKYFPTLNQDHQLEPFFIFIANIETSNPSSIIAGNERVIRPRLADAAFFWEQDKKTPLANRVTSLQTVTFQKQLGSLFDKTERLQTLTTLIAEKVNANVTYASRAAYLAKADLITDMVFEFTDLQGTAGYYYALASNEPDLVAQAIKEQYKPAGNNDLLPESKEGIALALADRLDNLTGLFGIGQPPSGTKDPFGLRRAAIGVLRIIIEHKLTLDLEHLITESAKLHSQLTNQNVTNEVLHYILDRLKNWYQEQAIGGDVLQAVKATRSTCLYDIDQRVQAVSQFQHSSDAETLIAANKRVRNFLAKVDDVIPTTIETNLFEHTEEHTLYKALIAHETKIQNTLTDGNYAQALTYLSQLKEPIDDFFTQVMVLTEQKDIRLNRLALLAKLQGLFMGIADLSLLN